MTTDRVVAFERDIAASPAALSRLLDGWVVPDLGGRRQFLCVGLGSSRFAGLVVAALADPSGAHVAVEYPAPPGAFAVSDQAVVVAVSASGATPEVVAAAEHHRGRRLVVALTNAPHSVLARTADIVVPLLAEEEIAGIACRTYRATIAALALLTGFATVADLRPAVETLERSLSTSAAWSAQIIDALDGAPSIDVLADVGLLGVAEQAALMLREAPRLPAHAWQTAEWLHTGVYLALPGHRVLLLPGSPSDAEVEATVRQRGGDVARLATDAVASPLVQAIGMSVLAEVIAVGLWERAAAFELGADALA